MNNLRYVPVGLKAAEQTALPKSWPALEEALGAAQKPRRSDEPGVPERFMRILARLPMTRQVLMFLGMGLVVVAMTFFCRREPAL